MSIIISDMPVLMDAHDEATLKEFTMNKDKQVLETWKARFRANRDFDGAKLSERAEPFLRGDNLRWILWEISQMECEIAELMRRTDDRA